MNYDRFDISITEATRGPLSRPAGLAVMPFSDIDVAVVNRIYSVLSRIMAAPGSAIAAWKAKAPKDAIALGQWDTPKNFLIDLAKANSSDSIKAQLPIVYVTRDPSIAFADPSMSASTDLPEVAVIEDGDGKAAARIMSSVASSTYVVNVVGFHDADIAPLAALFCMHLRDRYADKSMIVKTDLMGCPIATMARFSDGAMTTAANESAPFNQDRLRMLSVSVTVDVDFLMAEEIVETIATTTFGTEVIHG